MNDINVPNVHELVTYFFGTPCHDIKTSAPLNNKYHGN